MVDKVSDLSIDRIFWILGHGQLPVSPEKIIVYGLFFIGIVIFVNWLLSITVILVKPFLYAALMLAVIRPELVQCLATEQVLARLGETVKNLFVSFSVGITDLLQLVCEQFARRLN